MAVREAYRATENFDMPPMATLLTEGDHPSTMRELRITDVTDMTAMTLLRDEVEKTGFIWLNCDREGHEVCLVKIGSKNGATMKKAQELQLQRAVDAAGIAMLS